MRNSHGSGDFGFRCCETPIIKTSMPKALCLQRIVSERIIFFMKIVNRSFQRKECCSAAPVPNPGGGGVLGSIFAGFVPLASPNPYPIIVYSVTNYRPHVSHLWANAIFCYPNLVTF